MPLERLQKIIAAAGVASRRTAEKLISSGAVQVNGTVVTELGTKADPETDHVRVNGKLLHGAQRPTYLLLNKPKGYVTTMSDPEKRPTVMDLIHGVKGRVYPIGRLDYASEGLLLLTNAGTLTLSDATLSGAAALINNGAIVLDPSVMTIASLTGSGSVTIEAGSTLDVTGAIASSETRLYAVSPSMSMPAPSWQDADPDFWKRP